MTGLKLTLPVAFTDTSLPILRDDPLLTAGSLFLFDPIHEADPVAAGVPASGAVLPNIAWREAVATLGGATTKANVQPTYTAGGTGWDGALGKVERTAKGALHGIISQTQNTATDQGAAIALPQALTEYFRTHPTNDIYASIWSQITRPPLAFVAGGNMGSINVDPALFSIAEQAASTTNNLLILFDGYAGQTEDVLTRPNSGASAAQLIGRRATPGTVAARVGAPSFRSIAATAWTGTVPSTVGNARSALVWGSRSENRINHYTWNRHSSHVYYRAYVEDLTVSGRTYAQVEALDYALFAAAFGAGGRYAGDTFTDPATVA